MDTFDLILTIAAFVIGILLLSGHGSFFMKGGDEQGRAKIYDQEKTERASGVALILIGIITGINMLVTAEVFHYIYLVLLFIIFAGLVWYMKTKCTKK